jgi:hypothetical protein
MKKEGHIRYVLELEEQCSEGDSQALRRRAIDH